MPCVTALDNSSGVRQFSTGMCDVWTASLSLHHSETLTNAAGSLWLSVEMKKFYPLTHQHFILRFHLLWRCSSSPSTGSSLEIHLSVNISIPALIPFIQLPVLYLYSYILSSRGARTTICLISTVAPRVPELISLLSAFSNWDRCPLNKASHHRCQRRCWTTRWIYYLSTPTKRNDCK